LHGLKSLKNLVSAKK